VILGKDAEKFEGYISASSLNENVEIVTASTWDHILNLNWYLPPMPVEESFDYAIVAGLALEEKNQIS
jgi:hypothetical protein